MITNFNGRFEITSNLKQNRYGCKELASP